YIVVSVSCLPSTVSLFFLHGYADHRDLHSFPTRRSSDLPPTAIQARRVRRRFRVSSSRRPRSPSAQVRTAGPASRPASPPGSAEDRKSTRLNSSHVKISYAVFCLKKKKKKKTDQ